MEVLRLVKEQCTLEELNTRVTLYWQRLECFDFEERGRGPALLLGFAPGGYPSPRR